jgi:hypothetical protein
LESSGTLLKRPVVHQGKSAFPWRKFAHRLGVIDWYSIECRGDICQVTA